MKKVSRSIFSILVASMIFAAAFVSCSNGSSSDSSSGTTTKPGSGATDDPRDEPVKRLTDTATITEVEAVTTSGNSGTIYNNLIEFYDSNGKYVLSPKQETNSNMSARNVVSNVGGTWKYTETGAEIAKYAGSYTGDYISSTTITLKVEKIRNNGLLTAAVEEETFPMTLTHEDSSSIGFSAEIPAVKVSSVNTYFHGNVHAWNDNDKGIRLNSCVERIDLCDGVITYFAVGSDKGYQNCDDNSIQSFKGTYTITGNGHVLEGTVNGKTKSFFIQENGGLSSDPDGKDGVLEPISGCYTVYANCVTKLDGENSYALERIVYFKEDSGKTGQVMEFKQVYQKQSTSDMKNITYEKSGNTVTLTGTGSDEGYSKTATISADGESLTLDEVVYLKL